MIVIEPGKVSAVGGVQVIRKSSLSPGASACCAVVPVTANTPPASDVVAETVSG